MFYQAEKELKGDRTVWQSYDFSLVLNQYIDEVSCGYVWHQLLPER